MNAGDASDSISDDEVVFRRVPAKTDFYDPASDRPVHWIVFRPNRNDLSGISVWRARDVAPEEAATANSSKGKGYYVIALKVSDLRRLGAEVAPTPDEGGAGHASITSLSWHRYQGPEKCQVIELAKHIAREACQEVHGLFTAPAPEEPGLAGSGD